MKDKKFFIVDFQIYNSIENNINAFSYSNLISFYSSCFPFCNELILWKSTIKNGIIQILEQPKSWIVGIIMEVWIIGLYQSCGDVSARGKGNINVPIKAFNAPETWAVAYSQHLKLKMAMNRCDLVLFFRSADQTAHKPMLSWMLLLAGTR